MKKTLFILLGTLILIPPTVLAQAKLNRTKPVGASMQSRINVVEAVKLPTGTLENLLKPENKENLIEILSYQIVRGSLSMADVTRMKKAKAVQEQELKISSQKSAWMIDDAKLVKSAD